MGTDADPERLERIHDEIKELMSEASGQEENVEEDLNTVEDKVEFLQDSSITHRSGEDLAKGTRLFIDVCHHLVEDIRAENEINNELDRLEEDERTYVQLMNRIQSDDLPEDVRSRMQSHIGKISRDEIESAISQDREVERREIHEIREIIQELTEVYKELEHSLKGAHKDSLKRDAREAWVQLTHLETEL